MEYANITFQDPNPIKRWLQFKRLETAVQLSNKYLSDSNPYSICDFGGGNGELCKLLINKYDNSVITCYEPTPELYNEAKQNLLNYNVELIDNVNKISNNSVDIIFCLEVFEHLPPLETQEAFNAFLKILKPNGLIIIGIPIEIGIPALYKGLFRMFRRYGSYDANINNVIKSFLGKPPYRRPIIEIAPGFNYHSPHMGFNHRNFERECKSYFKIIEKSSSPFNIFNSFLMPEINFAIKIK